MSNKNFKGFKSNPQTPMRPTKPKATSLLDVMQDGREYTSLLDVDPSGVNMRDELRRAISAIETIRNRPLVVYAGNTISSKITDVPVSIVLADDLPFSEMVAQVASDKKAIDVLLVTPGGIAQQVAQFVNMLRPRFDDVAFVLPQVAMSAGTILALSGDEIWMDDRANLGPIDPQVPGREGRLLPAQALLSLIEIIRQRGEERLKNGLNPAWTDQLLLRHMDAKEIGDAHSYSQYSIQLAASFLEQYKFKSWTTHKNGLPVTVQERKDCALVVAKKLCDHDQWRTHSHRISREVAWNELQLKIRHLEDVTGLQRAVRRFWALMYYMFDSGPLAKVFISQDYSLFRQQPGATK